VLQCIARTRRQHSIESHVEDRRRVIVIVVVVVVVVVGGFGLQRVGLQHGGGMSIGSAAQYLLRRGAGPRTCCTKT